MKTIKLSYSILNAWMEHRFEDAIAMYLGKELPENPYLELGKIKHERWALYTLRTGDLHPELGGGKLKNPIVEQKYEKVIPMGDKFQILVRGVIDLEDDQVHGHVVTDYKCGIGRPVTYVDKWQLDMYKFLRPQTTLGRYICHDPYKCEAVCSNNAENIHTCYSIGIKFLDKHNAENALNNIITYGGEIIQYLEANRLIKDYKWENK